MIQDGSLKFKLMAYPGTAHASVAVLLSKSEEGFDPSVVECPWCGHVGMKKLHQKYSRSIVDWADGAPKDYSVEISCYVCTNPACRRKQAYLPDAIVPYAQYSFLFIMQVLQVYYERAMTVDEICETFEITRHRVYRWVDRFRDDLVVLLSFHVVVDHRQVQCICFHLLLQRMTFSEFCERYLQMTRHTPMQMHPVRSIVHTRTAHARNQRAAAALLCTDAAGASPMTPDTVRFKHSRLARPPTLSAFNSAGKHRQRLHDSSQSYGAFVMHSSAFSMPAYAGDAAEMRVVHRQGAALSGHHPCWQVSGQLFVDIRRPQNPTLRSFRVEAVQKGRESLSVNDLLSGINQD